MPKNILKLSLYFTVVSFFLNTPSSHAKESELKSLLMQLNTHIINLEKRVSVLEGKLQKTSNTIPRGIQEWRKLKKGMSMETVRRILGEPRRIEGGYLTYWYYSSDTYKSRVIFSDDNTVHEWTEPR